MTAGFASIADAQGRATAAFVRDGSVYDVSAIAGRELLPLVVDGSIDDPALLRRVHDALTPQTRLGSAADLDARFQLPFAPPEIWGAGVSYQRAAQLHEEDLKAEGKTGGLYDYVFSSVRPEIFFKGTARHAVGHNGFFGIRGDSQGIIVEAELACVFNREGGIAAYSIVNDVTAWDIEKESPLFLTYAKVFQGSCGFGPLLVPAHTVPHPKNLAVRCTIERKGTVVYDGEGSTSKMKRELEELRTYLRDCNDIPGGTVLCTGTAVGIPNDMIIEDGDRVSIEIERLGRLTTTGKRIPVPARQEVWA